MQRLLSGLTSKKQDELSSERFQLLTAEIRDIADLSEKLWEADRSFQEKVRQVQKEMNQLEKLLAQRSFEQLPLQKKQELHRSLLVSREELLKSLQEVPCPTDRIQ